MNLESELREEIEKWAKRMEQEVQKVELKDQSKKPMIENINAYIKDSGYFLQKGDLIRSFEAIIWAWSWIEILKELKIIKF